MLNPIDATAAVTAALIIGQPATTSGAMTMDELMGSPVARDIGLGPMRAFLAWARAPCHGKLLQFDFSSHLLRANRRQRPRRRSRSTLRPASKTIQFFAHGF